MGFSNWLSEHWFDFFQTIGIIASFLVVAYSTWKDERARRIGNSIAINDQHRNIWKTIYEHPELARVLDEKADAKEISIGEEMFVATLISHLSTVYRAMKHGEFVTLEGLQKDIQGFFALPIPKAVWEKFRQFQDMKFAAFVENSLRPDSSTRQ